jgi:hypothetical protein
MPETLKDLYGKLEKANIKLPDYNTFEKKYNSSEGADILYNKLNSANIKLPDINTFKSKYFAPKEEQGFLSKAWENVKTALTPNWEQKPNMWKLGNQQEFTPTEKEKQQTKKQLQELPAQKPEPQLDPIAQAKKDYDDVVNPFKEFRVNVPNPIFDRPTMGLEKVDEVGYDISKFGYIPQQNYVEKDGKKLAITSINKPENLDYDALNKNVTEFKNQKDEQIKKINGERLAKISEVYKKYPDEEGISAAHNQSIEINTINNEYDKKINEVEKSYKNLNENIFQGLLSQAQHADEIKNRKADSEDLTVLQQQLSNSANYLTNLNKQDKVSRLKSAAKNVLQSQYLGEDQEDLKESITHMKIQNLFLNMLQKQSFQMKQRNMKGLFKS